MRYTLLDMVKRALGALDSDQVNSISDTVESDQIAMIVKQCYYDCATDIALPKNDTLIKLVASTDPTKPCIMTVPENVVTLHDVKYDIREDGDTSATWSNIEFKTFDDFVQWQQYFSNLDTSEAGTQTIEFNGTEFDFLYRKDKHPEFYTVINDNTLIFDSFMLDLENTLQSSKTMCRAQLYPEFLMEDTFEPVLDPAGFAYLMNRVIVRASYELKQQVNEDATYEARRQKVIVQKRKRKTPDGPELWKTPRYGRV